MLAQIIESGIVVNLIALPDGASISSDGSKATWTGGVYPAPSGATIMAQNGAQIGWTLSGSTLAAPAAPTPPTPTLAVLRGAVISAASTAAAAIVAAIYPNESAQTALQNAADIVLQNSNVAPPSTSPFYAAFNGLASAYGMTPSAFAALVTTARAQSLALHMAEITLDAAATAATSSADLATALASFQSAIGAVVTAINAGGLPIPLAAPATIAIGGVNT